VCSPAGGTPLPPICRWSLRSIAVRAPLSRNFAQRFPRGAVSTALSAIFGFFEGAGLPERGTLARIGRRPVGRNVFELAAAGGRNVLEFVPAGGKPLIQSVELCALGFVPPARFQSRLPSVWGGGFLASRAPWAFRAARRPSPKVTPAHPALSEGPCSFLGGSPGAPGIFRGAR